MVWWSKALDYISAPLSQPKTFFTKGFSAGALKVKESRKAISSGQKSGLGTIITTVGTTATLATGILAIAGGSAAGAAGLAARGFVTKTLPKALIPKTIKGKIFGVTAGLVGAGVLKSSPKTRTFISETASSLPDKPSAALTLGGKIGEVIEGKTVFTKENIAEGAKAAGIVGAVAAGAALVIPKIKDKLTEEKAIGSAAPSLLNDVVAPQNQIIKEKPVGVITAPEQPKTTSIKTAPRKRYKRRTAKKTPQIRNSVRVNIVNAPKVTGLSMKRYIKNGVLA